MPWRIASFALITFLISCAPGATGRNAVPSSPAPSLNIRVANPYSLTLDAQERVIVADGQGRRGVLLDPRTGAGTTLASGLVLNEATRPLPPSVRAASSPDYCAE
jgi:hypothetical protein